MTLSRIRSRMTAGAAVNVLDFMTPEQQEDWDKGTLLFDHSDAINAAIGADEPFLPAGPFDPNATRLRKSVYLPDTPQARVEKIIYVRKGITFYGNALATRLFGKGNVVPAVGEQPSFVLGRRRVRATGTITNGSNQITNVTLVSPIAGDTVAGMLRKMVFGLGIRESAHITATSGTTLTMSHNATASGSISLEFAVEDPGGLPTCIRDFHFQGGAANAVVVDAAHSAGYFIENLFLTAVPIAVKLSGDNGKVHQVKIDMAQEGFRTTGQNHQISDCSTYLSNVALTVAANTNDLRVSNFHTQYSKITDILLPPSDPSNTKNIVIDGWTTVHNESFPTFIGHAVIRSNAARITFRNVDASNVKNWLFFQDSGVANEIVIDGVVADGRPTVAAFTRDDGVVINNGYAESLVGRFGFFRNSKVSVRNVLMRHLRCGDRFAVRGTIVSASPTVTAATNPDGSAIDLTPLADALAANLRVSISGTGIPSGTTVTAVDNTAKTLTLSGSAVATTTANFTVIADNAALVVQDSFGAGGVVDVEDLRYENLINASACGRVISDRGLINFADCTGDGVTPLFRPSQFISVKRKNVNWLGAAVVENGRRCVKVPFGPVAERALVRIAAATNPEDARNAAVKEILLFKRRDTSGGQDNSIVEIVESRRSAPTSLCPEIDVRLDIDQVGTGSPVLTKTHSPNGGHFAVSVPSTYPFVSFEAEIL